MLSYLMSRVVISDMVVRGVFVIVIVVVFVFVVEVESLKFFFGVGLEVVVFLKNCLDYFVFRFVIFY